MLKILNIILVTVLFVSCNKATIDLTGFGSSKDNNALLGKWKHTDIKIVRITNNRNISLEALTDEEAEGDMFMTFSANRKVVTTFTYEDEDGDLQSMDFPGTYTLSADKKELRIKDEDGEQIFEVLSSNSTSLVIKFKDTFEFGDEMEEYWRTDYYTKVK